MFKLQRLEITGFKSFAEYTEIVFTGAGITAVVGPNGCGKSNISDAITWVLGEQKAKNLRGGEMQDVIFAGTKTRQPSGMAEVVLHFVRVESAEVLNQMEISEIDENFAVINQQLTISTENIEEYDDDLNANELAFATNGNGFHREINGSETNGNGNHRANGNGEAAPANANPNQAKIIAQRRAQLRRAAHDFAPGEAVSITRRLYRSGDSEYRLNDRACRLRDIQDLFQGTGLSGGHYALVQQEKISQILSAKPADRRQIIEEAAGITRFRTRQRHAEMRLDSAKSNLRRISDIVSEIDKQANSLRRQAARTKRFKELQTDLRDLLKRIFVSEAVELNENLRVLRENLNVAAATENYLIETVAHASENANNATKIARAAEDDLAKLRQTAHDNQIRRERHASEFAHQIEQAKELEKRIGEADFEIASLTERLSIVHADANRLVEKNQLSANQTDHESAALRQAEDDYRKTVENSRQTELAVEKIRQELWQHTTAAERFQDVAKQQTAQFAKIAERLEGLMREGERAESTHLERVGELETAEEKTSARRADLSALQTAKQTAASELNSATEKLTIHEKELSRTRDEANRVRARRETLDKLDAQNALLAPGVQKLFGAAEKIGVNLRGTLADSLRVEARFEKVVEAAFAGFLDTVLVAADSDVDKIFDWLKTSGTGKINVLKTNQKSNSSDVEVNKDFSIAADSVQNVGDLIGVDDDLKSVLSACLPQAMNLRVIEDLLHAANFKDENCVTLRGEIIYKNCLFAFGTPNAIGKSSILSFKRELRELSAQIEMLAAELAAGETAVKNAREKSTVCQQKVRELAIEIERTERELIALEMNAKSIQGEIERAARHKRVVADEQNRLSSEKTQIESKRREAAADQIVAENLKQQAHAEFAQAAADLAAVKENSETANYELSRQRAEAAAQAERRRSLIGALRRVEAEQKELENRRARRRNESNQAVEKLKLLSQSLAELEKQTAATDGEKESETREITSAAAELQTARETADALAIELNELNKQAASAKDARARIEINQAETQIKLQNLHETALHELNLALNEIQPIEPDANFVLSEAKQTADVLRAKLESFGAVNLLALEELGETEARLLFLSSQRTDIVDGITAAEAALAEIKRRSRERFEFAFHEINRNFTRLFAEIFGGGTGEMNLLDASDVLESGVEIVAQPPGKRLQNLLLLSGGEKTLTAIALVLAIFKFRPAPFCLLDEVDAPLDEANVTRFVEKIREMSEQTQFLVITHNKRTMEAARALYGVTMEAAGVSKIVSVKFE